MKNELAQKNSYAVKERSIHRKNAVNILHFCRKNILI